MTGPFDAVRGTLGFGGANLGNLFRALDDARCEELLETAWAAGVRHYDTAPHYGLGLSERRLGAFLRTKPRDEYVLTSKVGRLIRPRANPDQDLDTANGFHVPADAHRVEDYTAAGMRVSIAESLERLGLDRLDVVYAHDPDEAAIGLDAALDQALPGLAEIKAEGLAGAVGVGTKSTAALAASVAHVDALMCAGRYTLAEQPAADVLDEAARRGVDVIAVGVYNSGLLASATPDPNSHYEYGAVPRAVYERVLAIAAACERHGTDLPTAALHFALRHPAVAGVVVGTSRPEQITLNLARAAAPVPEALWTELAETGAV